MNPDRLGGSQTSYRWTTTAWLRGQESNLRVRPRVTTARFNQHQPPRNVKMPDSDRLMADYVGRCGISTHEHKHLGTAYRPRTCTSDSGSFPMFRERRPAAPMKSSSCDRSRTAADTSQVPHQPPSESYAPTRQTTSWLDLHGQTRARRLNHTVRSNHQGGRWRRPATGGTASSDTHAGICALLLCRPETKHLPNRLDWR